MAIEMNWQSSLGKTNAVSQLSCMVTIFDEQEEKAWHRVGDVMALCDVVRDLQPCIGQIEKICEKNCAQNVQIPALG